MNRTYPIDYINLKLNLEISYWNYESPIGDFVLTNSDITNSKMVLPIEYRKPQFNLGTSNWIYESPIWDLVYKFGFNKFKSEFSNIIQVSQIKYKNL